jgi:hypothetical protein
VLEIVEIKEKRAFMIRARGVAKAFDFSVKELGGILKIEYRTKSNSNKANKL